MPRASPLALLGMTLLLLLRPACAGCPARLAPGHHDLRMPIEADGVTWERQFSVFVPEGLAGAAPSVMMWHGCGSDVEKFQSESGMNDRVGRFGFVAIWPRGTSAALSPADQHRCRSTGSVRCGWNSGYPEGGGCQTPDSPRPDDVEFTKRILSWMDDNLCVDAQRRFMAGFSKMVYKLNCELSQHFAGMMTLGMAARPATTPGLAECQPQKKIAALNLCGSVDRVSHCFADGRFDAQLTAFAEHNVCGGVRPPHRYRPPMVPAVMDTTRTEVSSTSYCSSC